MYRSRQSVSVTDGRAIGAPSGHENTRTQQSGKSVISGVEAQNSLRHHDWQSVRSRESRRTSTYTSDAAVNWSAFQGRKKGARPVASVGSLLRSRRDGLRLRTNAAKHLPAERESRLLVPGVPDSGPRCQTRAAAQEMDAPYTSYPCDSGCERHRSRWGRFQQHVHRRAAARSGAATTPTARRVEQAVLTFSRWE